MSLERITTLAEPPVVGRPYSVPTVEYTWLTRTKAWPVFPSLHEDGRFFPFQHHHYHVDPRFLTKEDWRSAAVWHGMCSALATCQRTPLAYVKPGTSRPMAHPPIVWRRRTCQRAAVPYQYHDHPTVQRIQAHYAGQQCKRAGTGWVCPHQNMPLGSFEPVEGVITCPLHGLRIDAETGKVLA